MCLAKAHYKVAKSPAQRGVSVQQLHTDYKAPEFLAALKLFLNSCLPQDKVVSPMESDQFDVFNQLYVKIEPSVVTGHDSSWQKIRAKLKVAACGRKAGSPARFDTAFVWDKGHQPRVFGGPDSEYPASSSQEVCADEDFIARDADRSSPRHIQTSQSSWPLPASTSVRGMVHLASSSRSHSWAVHRLPFDAEPSVQCVGDQC